MKHLDPWDPMLPNAPRCSRSPRVEDIGGLVQVFVLVDLVDSTHRQMCKGQEMAYINVYVLATKWFLVILVIHPMKCESKDIWGLVIPINRLTMDNRYNSYIWINKLKVVDIYI
jgi:hypothetical protein